MSPQKSRDIDLTDLYKKYVTNIGKPEGFIFVNTNAFTWECLEETVIDDTPPIPVIDIKRVTRVFSTNPVQLVIDVSFEFINDIRQEKILREKNRCLTLLMEHLHKHIAGSHFTTDTRFLFINKILAEYDSLSNLYHITLDSYFLKDPRIKPMPEENIKKPTY